MKKVFLLIFLLVIPTVLCYPYAENFHKEAKKIDYQKPLFGASSEKEALKEEPEYVAGEIVVKIKKGGVYGASIYGEDTTGIKKLREDDNAVVYKIKTEGDVFSAIEELKKNPDVVYAEPNYIYRTALIPNDPGFPTKWDLNQSSDKDMDAPEAWDITFGDKSIVIAVIDTGADYNHPDLADNIWNNTAEIPDNSIDDDNNGYIDDTRGWDFVDLYGSCYSGEDCKVEDNNPMDFHGHGTHCSGIAAAAGNNNIGVLGLCPNCTIMVLKAGYKGIDGYGYLEDGDIVQAIDYAVNSSANVISMSFGGPHSSAINDSLTNAYSRGLVLVAAAGNSNSETKEYPGGYDYVIAVAATDSNDAKAGFSNHGSWVDVAAPGVSINSTKFDDSYGLMSGTSMACPQVAGLAGLILSKNNFTNSDVMKIIKSSTEPVSSTKYIGTGRINAFQALQINETSTAEIIAPAFGEEIANFIILINGSANATNFVNYTVEYGSGWYPTSWVKINSSSTPIINSTLAIWDTTAVQDGIYIIKLTVNNTGGWTEDRREVLLVKNYNECYTCDDCGYKARLNNSLITLKNSVSSDGTCLDITGSNVTFDCNGYSITGPGAYDGINILNNGNTVKNCIVLNFSYGIAVNSHYNKIINNSLVNNNVSGIFLYYSEYNQLINNTLSDNFYGIDLLYSVSNQLEKNNMTGSDINLLVEGDYVEDYNNSIDTSNTAEGYPIYYLYNRSNEVIDNMTKHLDIIDSKNITAKNINLSSGDPFDILFSSNITVINITSSYGYYGLYIYKSENVNVNKSIITNNIEGIIIEMSNFTSLWNNTVKNNNGTHELDFGFFVLSFPSYGGIDVFDSQYGSIDSNIIAENSEHGIYSEGSSEINITNNNISSNYPFSIFLTGTAMKDYKHYIDTKNAVNGLPAYYYFGQDDLIFNNETHYLFFGNSTNITLGNINFTSGIVHFAFTNNSSVRNSTLYSNYYGMKLDFYNNITIEKNSFYNNTVGLYLYEAEELVIYNNSFYNNNESGIYLGLYSKNNEILKNNISFNRYGIIGNLTYENNRLYNNTIFNNSQDGIAFLFSLWFIAEDNKIFNNNGSGIYWDYNYANISRNTITNNSRHGIRIHSGSIWQNNIYGNGNGENYQVYSNATIELSRDKKGNYWGHRTKPYFMDNDSNSQNVVDSYPYGIENPWLCGNGIAEGEESSSTCCEDAGCASGYSCNTENHECYANPPSPPTRRSSGSTGFSSQPAIKKADVELSDNNITANRGEEKTIAVIVKNTGNTKLDGVRILTNSSCIVSHEPDNISLAINQTLEFRIKISSIENCEINITVFAGETVLKSSLITLAVIPKICESGQVRCNGTNLEQCFETYWSTVEVCQKACEENRCIICIEGEKKCDGNVLKTCANNAWAEKICYYGCAENKCIEKSDFIFILVPFIIVVAAVVIIYFINKKREEDKEGEILEEVIEARESEEK